MKKMEIFTQEDAERMLAEGIEKHLIIRPCQEGEKVHYAIDVLADGYNIIDFTLYDADPLATTVLKYIIEEKFGFTVESPSSGFVSKDDLDRLDKAYSKLMVKSTVEITRLQDELTEARCAANRREDLVYNAICYLKDAGLGQEDVLNILGLTQTEYKDIVNKRDIIFDEDLADHEKSSKINLEDRMADARVRSETQATGKDVRSKDEYTI
ncbi:MAG: hypothetical protein IJZ42_13190 [Lachnospiraceae bacterium]|nr:hypothetical protein [Lachnospiraceae bacterium]